MKATAKEKITDIILENLKLYPELTKDLKSHAECIAEEIFFTLNISDTNQNLYENLDIQKNLVVSTKHITAKDRQILKYKVHSLIVEYFELGWRIYVVAEDIQYNTHFSKELKDLIIFTQKLNCTWLVLDRDGNVYDQFPTFDC